MLTEKLNYKLPESLIAQYPCGQRDQSRLMVVDRASGAIHIDVYQNLTHYLNHGDVLVLTTRGSSGRVFTAVRQAGAR